MNNYKMGRIIEEGGVNVWPHERQTANALSKAGFTVTFTPANPSLRMADAYIDGTLFEFKSPCGKGIGCIKRNLNLALHQSNNIVIDSARIKGIHDSSIQSFLVSKLKDKKGIKRLLFVNRERKVIDINSLI